MALAGDQSLEGQSCCDRLVHQAVIADLNISTTRYILLSERQPLTITAKVPLFITSISSTNLRELSQLDYIREPEPACIGDFCNVFRTYGTRCFPLISIRFARTASQEVKLYKTSCHAAEE